MDQSVLAGWQNFYVITGSSAGGLTGLMFVVITLIRDSSRVRITSLRAFVTPTIVHFSAVLALSAFLSMPHQSVATLSAGFGLAGVAGLLYCGVIGFNMSRHGSEYKPGPDDWAFNVIVPSLLYLSSAVAAFLIHSHLPETLFGVAGIALGLLFLAIRNSWDIAIYMTLSRKTEPR
jgi:hypothetical protein